MKDLRQALLLMCAVIMFGSVLTACETIGPLFGQYKNEIAALVSANAAGTYTVTFSKGDKVLHTESWTCKAVPGKLPVCNRDTAQTMSPDVTAPPVPVK